MVANRNVKRKKAKKNVPTAIAHIYSTFNNTIITITDQEGNAICWSSSGAIGFKGAKKSTPYAAQLVAKAVTRSALENGVKNISVHIKGIGPGKDSALRQFQASELEISDIKNVTPVPHNGVKKPKKFRRK
ncbi:MAG: 30S ribosomal protein S11 [Candidatus Hepatoplasma vulgare]|nr:MAG: 30S ribosomal protein S11 [Candidatus Hepatoplasma sp.]